MARALGFDAIGIARADVPLDVDFERYGAFVEGQMHGEMAWLAANAEARRRLDGDEILAGAKSVVCLARRYQRTDADERGDPDTARTIARYARGRDYHGFLKKRIRKLAAFVRTLGTPEAPVHARALCDDAPVLERAWAARAGLGFVGKNGLLIVPGVGSLVLLGEVVTTLVLEPDPPIPERCGSCTRCLDACPTGAFLRPFVLEPTRCVSYLTIEHRSAIDVTLRDGIGEHLFGCDDCQTVCPFNRARALGTRGESVDDVEAEAPFRPLARWSTMRLEALMSLSLDAWREISEGTPVKRAHSAGLARNAAIVLGNRGEGLVALHGAAREHPDAMVREAAAWAVAKIERR
jgi:epoxyqueuosine reductase